MQRVSTLGSSLWDLVWRREGGSLNMPSFFVELVMCSDGQLDVRIVVPLWKMGGEKVANRALVELGFPL